MRFAILAAVAALGMSAPVQAAVSISYQIDLPLVGFAGAGSCKSADPCVYSDSFTFDTNLAYGGPKAFGILTLVNELGGPTITYTSFKLNGVELINEPNHTDNSFGTERVRYLRGVPILTVNEVAFSTLMSPQSTNFAQGNFILSDSPVPEPATWALAILGFGMIGWQIRSRLNQAYRLF